MSGGKKNGKPFDSGNNRHRKRTQPKENPEDSSGRKTKRHKTFTGCFKCRTRKIRCDLGKPSCVNCTKAGLLCSGYDIKLKWSEPIRFVSKSGEAIGSLVVFSKKSKGDDEGMEFFQRRTIELVRWDHEYETYDDIDRDIALLNNPTDAMMLLTHNNTKLMGPFGVFSSTIPVRPRKKGDSNGRKENAKFGQDRWKGSEEKKDIYTDYGLAESYAPDQLWLSNELRDDAILTAAALNGDLTFLDLMKNWTSSSNSDILPPSNGDEEGSGYSTLSQGNPNSFLNVLFHKNNSLQSGIPNYNSNNELQQSSVNSLQSGGVISQKDGSLKLIGPSNQHMYYSNYSNYYYDNPYKMNDNLEIELHASKNLKVTDEGVELLVEGESARNTHMPPSLMAIVENPLQPKIGFDLKIPVGNQGARMEIPLTALQVQPLTRYLLNYYNKVVADLMTVIPLTENPWKIIYFPKALMAIGELLALGKTSNAKNALLNALLAVLAFNIQSKFPKNSEPMKFYLNLGIRLRNQASLFVRYLLGPSIDSQADIERCLMSEKYKDVLCAVLSMISVDLVWGTMQDTNLYIKWCGRVINTKMAQKKKLSARARVLHRIFLSLKLIQNLTCLDIENIKEDFQSLSGLEYDVNGDRFFGSKNLNGTPSSKGKIDFILDGLDPLDNFQQSAKSTLVFANKKLINTKKNNDSFATDALYGLPKSLIILFSETVKLLRSKIYHEEIYKEKPTSFPDMARNLGEKLGNWQLDWVLYLNEESSSQEKKFISPMHEVTFHHIMSFYHALNIYYERFINGTSPEELQNKVQKTLEHLDSIQKLIAQGEEASIIPLFWQGFIAGCEATSESLQLGFKKWGADIAQYLGSYWGARQIMLEVWRRKRLKEPHDDWASVIRDWEMNLMLN